METKLSVRDLRISFRTTNGKVQAVRGINFDLAKGETLAIVGESGSGKSVTSKAILGIQAGNSINESGEIIYDGKDLLKINEDDFHKIRGDKIAMIFQDPMSSLNPIVKIGRQLTEAMILKGKARQRESKQLFADYMGFIQAAMLEAKVAEPSKVQAMCSRFIAFTKDFIQMEAVYDDAREACREAAEDGAELSFELSKYAAQDTAYRVKTIAADALKSIHPYLVHENADRVTVLSKNIQAAFSLDKKGQQPQALIDGLNELVSLLKAALEKTQPNLFALAYAKEQSLSGTVEEVNKAAQELLDAGFMNEFMGYIEKALAYSAEKSYIAMTRARTVLGDIRSTFEQGQLVKSECDKALKSGSEAVFATIDKLAIVKDSLSYTFPSSVKSEIERYFSSIGKNAKAEKLHRKQQAKFDKLVARGKTPDWKVAAAAVTDLDMVRENILHLIDRLNAHYAQKLTLRDQRDYAVEAAELVIFLKSTAAGIIAKVTKGIAKSRAIKLMEEVGIAQPRKRYNQYPFEFSGGMRQRIVIAIALAANPDILICDEPTTALDVTIQSQILELINQLKRERQLSVIFITHDLGVVANMADRVAVMYAGKIVEYGTAEEIFYDPKHPYTWALLSSMPDLDTKEKLEAIPGTPPNMIYPPVGDAFAARNKYAMEIDFEQQPPMFKVSETHYAATWLLHPDAPKVAPPKTLTDRIARMENKRGTSHGE